MTIHLANQYKIITFAINLGMLYTVKTEYDIMNVTLENYRTLNFDTIDIKEEWNMPAEREHRMHSIHAYPAKFPAFITTKAIQKAEEKNISVDIVADIFCGCGTVAFETVKNGKSFWGCDINPVATLIAKTKSLSYNDGLLGDYYDNIISCYNESSINEDDEIYKNERVRYWFDDEHINDLLKLKTAIYEKVDNEIYRNFFLCAFSNILKPCSRWLTKSIKPQIDPNKQPKNVLASFNAQIRMMRNANLDEITKKQGCAEINCTNFLDVNIETPFVDLVVTSPPYVTSYEYADLHQLSTLWLGYTDDFRTLREGTIGSLYHAENFDENIKILNETALDIVYKMYSTDKRKTRSVAQYYIDMQGSIHKVYKMLKPNGACLFVIGNTEYKGVKIDNAKHLTECLLKEGFVDVEVDRRKISNKILTPYRDANGKFASVKGSSRKIYSEEFVIFARKE